MEEKIKVLILEDVIEDLELVVFELRRAEIKFTHLHVETEVDFRKGLVEFKPDIILSDYKLPQFTGMEALLIAKEITPLTPFIIVTGSLNEETAVNCIKAGAWNYVIKENLVRLGPAVTQSLEKKTLIESRINTEETLKESEEKYRTFINTASDLMCITNKDGQLTDVNRAMVDILGYSIEELRKMHISNLLTEEALKNDFKPNWGKFIEEGKINIETTFKTKSRNEIPGELKAIAIYNSLGKIIGTRAVFYDLTDRKLAEEALRESEEKYKIITDSTLDIIFMIDKTGKQLFFNESVERVLGYKVEEVTGKSFSKFVLKRDIPKYLIQLKNIFMKKEIRNFITQIYHKDGHLVDVEINGKLIKHKENYVGLGTIRDITKRKQAEEALRVSESEKSWMLESMLNAFVLFESVFDEKGEFVSYRFVYINDAYEKITGVKKDQVKGKTVHEVWPGTEPEWLRRYGEVAVTGKSQSFDLYHAPTLKTYYCNVYRPFDSSERFCVIFEDISERKQAEEQEKDHRRNIELISETAMKFVEFQQDENIYTYIGEQLRDFIGKDSYVIVNSVNEEAHSSTIQTVLGMGKFTDKISKLLGKHPVGMTIDVEDPNIHYTDGKFHVYEEGLYGLLLKTVPKTICDSIEKLLKIKEIYVIDLAKQEHFFGSIIILLKDSANEFKNKQVIETFIKQASIAVQKRQAEEALVTSEAQLSNVMEIAKLGYWEYDVDADMFTFDDHFYDIFRTTAEKVGGYKMSPSKYAERFLHPDDIAVVANEMKKAIETTDPNFSRTLEHRIIYADGEFGYISVRYSIVKDNQGRTLKTFGANQDITERKKMENELKDSEIRYHNLFENSSEFLFTLDLKGNFMDVNKAAENLTGYSKAELLEMNFKDYAPQKDHKSLFRAFLNIYKTGQVLHDFPLKAFIKDGSIKYFETSFSLLKKGEQVIGFQGSSKDISERKQAEEEIKEKSIELEKQLKKSEKQIIATTIVLNDLDSTTKDLKAEIIEHKLAEEKIKRNLNEKNALLQELYHRTKNNMQLIASMLKMQSRSIENRSLSGISNIDFLHDSFDAIINRIKAMSLVHQKLYQAEDLSQINLKEFIKDLVNHLMKSYHIRPDTISVKLELEDVFVLIDSAIPMSLVLNELISNVFKHAFTDNAKGEIFIRLFKEEDETINIHISDNGVGIPKDIDLEIVNTIGLQTVYSLTRHQLKGEVNYKTDNGLKWQISFKDNLHKERV
ncbi:MAG: PAS domain S-box protein [Candidatus Cloacimonetes bacterium]|jgi:PAS domain S-box-containing protein|nr:PAS domain S-box protein [Candidatus Cloacimonadota bacterium]